MPTEKPTSQNHLAERLDIFRHTLDAVIQRGNINPGKGNRDSLADCIAQLKSEQSDQKQIETR